MAIGAQWFSHKYYTMYTLSDYWFLSCRLIIVGSIAEWRMDVREFNLYFPFYGYIKIYVEKYKLIA